MKFKLNLIREIQAKQEARKTSRKKTSVLIILCYSLLTAVLAYGALDVLKMRATVIEERTRLEQVKAEYQRYKASEMIVTKAEVELLDRLQSSRIFWTKKLLVMARYLPENYWITRFGYDRSVFVVEGYGYISDKQEQLLTLHDYLDALRKDISFTDVFPVTYLNSTIRSDEGSQMRDRGSFSYTSIGRK